MVGEGREKANLEELQAWILGVFTTFSPLQSGEGGWRHRSSSQILGGRVLGGRESVQHYGPHYQHLLHAIKAFPIGKSLHFFSRVQGCPVAVSSWADRKV